MKTYKNLNYILLILFVILYPILPSYGIYSSDLIIYSLILLNIVGFLFIPTERKNVISIIKSIYKDKIFLSVIFLNVCMYISVVAAEDKRLALTNSIRFSLYVFVFYLITYSIRNKRQINVILNSFLFTAILSSIVCLYQVYHLVAIGERLTNTNNRVAAFLENPNNLGAYTILSIFIVIMLIIKSDKKSMKLFYGAISILLLSNIIFSQSRNALIGLFIGVVLLALLYDKRLIIGAFMLPVILLLIPQSKIRIMQILDVSQNSSRFKIWETAKLMIKDNPIFGIGYENFQFQYPIYVNNHPDKLLISDSYLALHPHNIFLKFQAELGILGTISLLLFIAVTIISLYKLIHNSTDKYVNAILTGVLCSFIAIHCMNLIDNFYGAPKVLISMFVILGIANFYKLKFNTKHSIFGK